MLRYGEIARHLSQVMVIEGDHHFRVNNHKVVYDHVGYEQAHLNAPVINGISLLLINVVTTSLQFYSQCVLIYFFIQPWF